MTAPRQTPAQAFNFTTARKLTHCDQSFFEPVPRVEIFQNRLDHADFCINASPAFKCMICGQLVNFMELADGKQEIFGG